MPVTATYTVVGMTCDHCVSAVRAELTAVYRQARACTYCPELAGTRTQVAEIPG